MNLQRWNKLSPTQLWLLLVVVLLLWRIPYYGKVVLDDPFITFRYATNLVESGQLVFNSGQNVLATTTPTYALLMAAFAFFNISVPTAAVIVNLLFEALLLYVIGQYIRLLTPEMWRLSWLVAGVLVLSNRAISIASNSGMETALFTLLNITTLWLVTDKRYLPATIIGSLATLTRPDGIFVLGILGLAYMLDKRRFPLLPIGISILIALPWLVFSQLTYGSIIPHSVTAKSAIEHIWFSTLTYKLTVVFIEPLRFWGLIILPLIVLAASRFTSKAKWLTGLPILLFTLLHLAYMILPSNLGFEWYFAPLFATFAILTGIGLAYLWQARSRRIPAIICSLILLLGLGHSTLGNYLSVREIDQIWQDGMFQVVDYLNTNADADAIIQTTNIGIIAFYSDFQILDPLGLASPEVIPLFSETDELPALSRLVAQVFKPDYVVSFDYEDYAGYAIVAEFPTSSIPLVIYQRSDEGA